MDDPVGVVPAVYVLQMCAQAHQAASAGYSRNSGLTLRDTKSKLEAAACEVQRLQTWVCCWIVSWYGIANNGGQHFAQTRQALTQRSAATLS